MEPTAPEDAPPTWEQVMWFAGHTFDAANLPPAREDVLLILDALGDLAHQGPIPSWVDTD